MSGGAMSLPGTTSIAIVNFPLGRRIGPTQLQILAVERRWPLPVAV